MSASIENEQEVIDIPLLELGDSATGEAAKPRVPLTFQEEFGVEPKWAVAILLVVVVILFGIIIWLGITRPSV